MNTTESVPFLRCRVLPELDDRLRYRAEFLAELHELSPVGQLRDTAGVLSQTFALRAALGFTPTRAEEDAMTPSTTTRPFFWRCRILRRHRWVIRSTDDGSRYEACSRCGRERDDLYEPTGGIGMGAMLKTGGGGASSSLAADRRSGDSSSGCCPGCTTGCGSGRRSSLNCTTSRWPANCTAGVPSRIFAPRAALGCSPTPVEETP